jgi:hypothetical protein
MAALLEDTYGHRTAPFRTRLLMAGSGLVERARESGLLGDTAAPIARVRAGLGLVLCGWAAFVVAGGIFAKFSEHWDAFTPTSDQLVPAGGYNAVQVAGAVGMLVVLTAAVFIIPACVRLVRGGGWQRIRRPVLSAIIVGSVALAMLVGGVAWAHQLTVRDRNGGLASFQLYISAMALAIVAAIATSTAAAIAVARNVQLSARALHVLTAMACALTLLMGVIVAGMAIWWGTVATYAPQFLRTGIGNGTVVAWSAAPPALLAAGTLMVVGLAIAVLGIIRAARTVTAIA